jgi:tetratricopeptide (TPR) repeat protein
MNKGTKTFRLLSLIAMGSVAGSSPVLSDDEFKPIANPFVDQTGVTTERGQAILLRGKNQDGQAVEVEIPQGENAIGSLTLPMQDTIPGSAASGRKELPVTYQGQRPTQTDREIASRFPKAGPEEDSRRSRIEQDLGLQTADNPLPNQDSSYLASIDLLKQLYRGGRYEAALIESDKMIRLYPTDPKLQEMRGTLLDRLGYYDLALESWNEALRLNPRNLSLKKWVDRKTRIYQRTQGGSK